MTHKRIVVLSFFFFFISVNLILKKSIYCDNTKSITMANIWCQVLKISAYST